MSHFNLKSLSFYGTAIGSVAVLFKLITAYGETQLAAPPPLDGRYQITSKKLPSCLKSRTLALTIHQSGIYLNGVLRVEDEKAKSTPIPSEKPSLEGRWNDRQLNLSGLVAFPKECEKSSDRDGESERQTAKIQGKMEKEILKGKIILSSLKDGIEFTAKREAPTEQQETH